MGLIATETTESPISRRRSGPEKGSIGGNIANPCEGSPFWPMISAESVFFTRKTAVLP